MTPLSAKMWRPAIFCFTMMTIAAVALTACGSGSDGRDGGDGPAETAVTEEPRLVEAAKESYAASSSYVEVLDNGNGLSIDGEGEEAVGASIDEIACILVELDVPDVVTSRMEQTRALDGMQDATWGDLTASWTYHPDNGLDIIVETLK